MLSKRFNELIYEYQDFQRNHTEAIQQLNDLRSQLRFLMCFDDHAVWQLLAVFNTSPEGVDELAAILGKSSFEIYSILESAEYQTWRCEVYERLVSKELANS